MKRIILAVLLFVYATLSFAQTGEIHGRVVDASTEEPLANANVLVLNDTKGTTTDKNGEFILLKLEPGEYTLKISYIGYKTVTRTCQTGAKSFINIPLDFNILSGEQVVVSGNRHEKKIAEIAQPIETINAIQILETAPRTVSDILNKEAGLTMVQDGIWGSYISIRGLSRNNIVTLIDGNRIDTATDLAAGLSMLDINDVQQIEVIKGASSSLYGTGAVGGVVNIITKDGWYEDRFYTRINVNSGFQSVNNSRNARIGLQLGARKWYVKMSAMQRKADNINTPEGILNNSQYNDENFSIRAGFMPFQHHEIKINAQRYYAKDVGIPGGYPLFPSAAEVRYPREKRELLSAEYIFHDHILPRITLKYFIQNILRDVENIPHTVKSVPAADGQPAKNLNVLRVTPAATHYTQGLLLQTDWALNRYNYLVAGIEAWQKQLDSHREKSIRIDVLDSVDGSIMKTIDQVIGEQPLPESVYRNLGVFIQDETNLINDKFLITLGGRYDKIFVANEAAFNPLYTVVDGVKNGTPANQTVLWEKTKENDRSWSGNIGLLYKATGILNFTLNAARSFRSPYLEERYQYIDLGNLVKIGDPNLEPESGTFIDLGLRILHTKLSFYSNIFYYRLKNLVVEVPSTYEGRAALKKANVGSAELYGADFKAEYILNLLTFYANAAYVYGKDTFFDTSLPFLPPLNGRIGIRLPVADICRINFSATLYADQNRISDGEFRTPGYTYFDLYISTRLINMFGAEGRLSFGLENMLNRAYRNHLSTNRGSISVEPGRNITVGFSIER
ncbi:TonB-dependent receptor [candidate division KSB1 bacterium]|nr:TonB-dependent receptor [candidate division KSB1 bacterium]